MNRYHKIRFSSFRFHCISTVITENFENIAQTFKDCLKNVQAKVDIIEEQSKRQSLRIQAQIIKIEEQEAKIKEQAALIEELTKKVQQYEEELASLTQ